MQFVELLLEHWALSVILFILFVTLVILLTARKWLDEHFSHFRHILDIKAKRYRFLKHFLLGFIFMVGVGFAVYLIPPLRSLSVSIFAGAGVLAIVLGFAAQHALSNVISGFFIAIFKPFRVGDWVKIGEDDWGTVEDITLRHTVIRYRDNRREVIPNDVVDDSRIVNASIEDSRVCEYIEFPLAYDADIDKVRKVMQREAMKHPNFVDHRTQKEKDDGHPKVKVKVIGYGDSSMTMRAWVWARNPYLGRQLRWDLNESIKKAFDKNGIEIPYPHRTLLFKDDVKKRRKKIKRRAK